MVMDVAETGPTALAKAGAEARRARKNVARIDFVGIFFGRAGI
jgi:hypothetical protein